MQMSATLSLDVDEKQWNAADEAIKVLTRDLQAMAVRAVLATTDVRKAMGVIGFPGGANAGKKEEAAKGTENAVKGLTGQLIKLYAVARGAIGLKNTVENVVGLGAKLTDLHDQTGLNIESMQELGHAAQMSGSDFNEIVGSIKKFNKGLESAAKTGKGDVVDGLKSIGISFSAARKTLKQDGGMDVLLGQIADKFKDMPAGSKKAAAAMNLFGKQGANLIPFLNNGSEGLAELRKEARELGVVIDEDSIGSLKALGDQGDKLEATWDGLKRQMVVALIPTLKELVTGLSEFIKENREAIATTMTVVVKSLAVAFQVLGDVVGIVVKVFKFLVENWELGVAVLAVLLGAVVAFAAPWVATMISVAAANVAAFAPLLLVAALLAGIILVVKDVWKSITTGKGIAADVARAIRDKFRDMARAVEEAFRAAGAAVRQLWEDLIAWIEAKIKWVDDRINAIKKKLDKAADEVRELIGDDAAGLGVDFLQAQMGGMSGAEARVLAGSSATTTNVDVGGITVNSPNADPKQVADEVRKQMDSVAGMDPADADVMK